MWLCAGLWTLEKPAQGTGRACHVLFSPYCRGNHFLPAPVLSLLSTCVTLGTGTDCQQPAWTCCLLSCPHSVPQLTSPLRDDCAPLLKPALGWVCSPGVEYKHKAPGLIPMTYELDVVAQACNPTFQGVEAGESKFNVILGYLVSFGGQPWLRDPVLKHQKQKLSLGSSYVLTMCHQIHHPRAVLTAPCRRQGSAQG